MISILPESNYAAIMTETVEPYLDSRRQEMDMPLIRNDAFEHNFKA